MKIVFPLIKAGSGSDAYTYRLAKALGKRNISCDIIEIPGKYELFPQLALRKIKKQGEEIIHANTWNGFAFKYDAIPLVVTAHHNVFDEQYIAYKSLLQHVYHNIFIKSYERRSIKGADRVITVSDYTCQSYKKDYPESYSKIIPIYNWLDEDVFKLERNNRSNKSRFILLFVGNNDMRKGFDLLPRILARLDDGFELWYTSGGRHKEQAIQDVRAKCLGRLSDAALVEAYNQADALLFPSRFEGFGYAVVEAMACGLPVITTNSSSLTELVENNITGRLCNVNDVSDYAEACNALRDSPGLCKELSLAAHDFVVDKFSDKKIIDKYIELYSGLL
jgi:glycosyltransferase involved in cell wall biosynthesis